MSFIKLQWKERLFTFEDEETKSRITQSIINTNKISGIDTTREDSIAIYLDSGTITMYFLDKEQCERFYNGLIHVLGDKSHCFEFNDDKIEYLF